jgi:hypothetical protein
MKHIKLFEHFSGMDMGQRPGMGGAEYTAIVIPSEDSFRVATVKNDDLASVDFDELNRSLDLPEMEITQLPLTDERNNYLRYSYDLSGNGESVAELVTAGQAQTLHRENAHSLLAVSDSNGEIHWSEDEDWEFDDNKGMWLIPIIKDECIYVNGQYGDIEIQGSAIDCINDY